MLRSSQQYLMTQLRKQIDNKEINTMTAKENKNHKIEEINCCIIIIQ